MSDGSTPPGPRRFRGTPALVLAALVPALLAGWVLWRAVDGGQDGGEPPSPLPVPGASSASPSRTGDASPGAGRPSPSRSGASPTARPAPRSGPLSGTVVVLDPGHNRGNRDHTGQIARSVDIGTHRKECDTTGTATDSGYAEADFTLDVARRIRALLRAQGARVVFTHDGDRPWGPCVDERARIGNAAHADAVVSVHADGSAPGNRGFHVILPASVHRGAADTAAIVGPSRALGERIAGRFVRATGSGPANYLGGGTGLDVRSDLGGLNLSTVPKVFVECGNMRDARDADLLTSARWRQRAARGIADGIGAFLTSRR